MSLFRSREWWAVNLNENEMYDSQCLLTVKLGNDKFESILLGSHKGVLRLFSPNSESLENVSNYKPSHLLLEVQLGSPILQINEGFLVSGSTSRYLAILHPRLFSVYVLKKKESEETNLGDQMEIELAYQHVLRHSAHSFVLGSFGGVRGRHFICIQSLDGLLSFYEQEAFAFQLYLPTFVLPCTFAYLEKIDSFLFLNGLLILDCYSYEALASVGSSNDKKILKTWEHNLGENILDINTLAKNGLTIVILSERNLYGLNENGKMIFTKRLESKPVGFHCYLTEDKSLMIIIATEGGFLNFYEEVSLKWSMKIDIIPVSLKRIFVNGLSGGIVLLSEDGLLQIVYIGTHPSVYLIPQMVQPEIDLHKAQSQLSLLQQKIADNDLIDPMTADVIGIKLKIDRTAHVQSDARSCNVVLEISAQYLISKIQITFVVEPPLTVKSQNKTIFDCQEEVFIENTVYVKDACILSSLIIQVVVIYITSEGVTRSIQKSGSLPLDLVVSESTPLKEAQHKITITTNKSVCGVNQLFREFASENTSSNAIGLTFNSGEVVSILAAKSSQRYRLQSDSLAAITVILQALLERLKIHFQKDSEFTLMYSSPLPLDEFFEKILIHQGLIQRQKILEENLSKQTSQFIAIQKKVLAKLKDVAPKSSSNLHNILKETLKMIETSIEELENTERDLFFSRSCLRSLNRLMITLLELMSVRKDDLKFLKIAFNPHVQDADDQGWLEVQEAAMSFLLRTALAKSMKDQQKLVDVFLEPLTDTSKLTKHFASIIERVTKGTYLLERNDFEGKKEAIVTIQAAYESDESLFDDAIPFASKLLSDGSTAEKLTSKSESYGRAVCSTQIKEEEEEIDEESDKKAVGKEEGQSVQESLPGREETEGKEDQEEEEDDGIWDVKIMEMRI